MTWLVALLHALRRRFRRWQATRLLAQGLPRGELPPAPPLALREPLLLPPGSEEPGGSYPALRLSARAIRAPAEAPPLLLRLSALPPPLLPIDRLRLENFRIEERPAPLGRAAFAAERHRSILREPRRRRPAPLPIRALGALKLGCFRLDEDARPIALARGGRGRDEFRAELLRPPPPPRLPEIVPIAVARPERLGLDDDGLPPAAREPPPIAADRAGPLPARASPRPRQPLARAPVSRIDPRAFRLDRVTLEAANEIVIQRDAPWSFAHPLLYSEICAPRYLEQRFWTSPIFGTEWFVWWQDVEHEGEAPGGRDAVDWPVPEGLWWKMQECKEQMLIRRDVAKDEDPPKPSDWMIEEFGEASLQKPPAALEGLIPAKQWIASNTAEVAKKIRPMLREMPAAGAYLQWLTLMRGLLEF